MPDRSTFALVDDAAADQKERDEHVAKVRKWEADWLAEVAAHDKKGRAYQEETHRLTAKAQRSGAAVREVECACPVELRALGAVEAAGRALEQKVVEAETRLRAEQFHLKQQKALDGVTNETLKIVSARVKLRETDLAAAKAEVAANAGQVVKAREALTAAVRALRKSVMEPVGASKK